MFLWHRSRNLRDFVTVFVSSFTETVSNNQFFQVQASLTKTLLQISKFNNELSPTEGSDAQSQLSNDLTSSSELIVALQLSWCQMEIPPAPPFNPVTSVAPTCLTTEEELPPGAVFTPTLCRAAFCTDVVVCRH